MSYYTNLNAEKLKTIKYSTAVSRYLKASGQSKNQAGTKAADKQLSSLNKLTTATAQKLTNAAVKQVSAKFQEMLTDGTFLNAVMEDLDPHKGRFSCKSVSLYSQVK